MAGGKTPRAGCTGLHSGRRGGREIRSVYGRAGPAFVLSLHEHPAVLDLNGINRYAQVRILGAEPGGSIELPAMPGADDDGAVDEPIVSAGLAFDALLKRAEAQLGAGVGAPIADRDDRVRARVTQDANLAPTDPSDRRRAFDDVGLRSNVVPGAHLAIGRLSRLP